MHSKNLVQKLRTEEQAEIQCELPATHHHLCCLVTFKARLYDINKGCVIQSSPEDNWNFSILFHFHTYTQKYCFLFGRIPS